MALKVTATLDYLVNSYGATAANLAVYIEKASLPLPTGLFAKASVSVTSDVSSVVGGQARRRLILNLQQPQLQITNQNVKLIPGLLTPTQYALQVYSSSADDNFAGGVGARSVQIGWLDATGTPQSDTFNLSGKTPVFGGAGLLDCAGITQTNTSILTAGALGANRGTLYIRAVQVAGNYPNDGIVGCIPDSFYNRFPNGSDQKSPFQGLLTQLLSQAVGRVVTQDVALS